MSVAELQSKAAEVEILAAIVSYGPHKLRLRAQADAYRAEAARRAAADGG